MGAAANAHARHQHRSCLQRHVRQPDGHSSTYIILFLGTAAKALIKGIETWKKETMMKKAEKQLESDSKPGGECTDKEL
ncbi:unnamed protein product [Prunus armeniaca]